MLVRELAHELLHQTVERRQTTTQTVRETEAKAVAYVVSTAIGLDNGGHCCDYIRLWNGDTATLGRFGERDNIWFNRTFGEK